ncbi:hypothetical protein PpBr36_07204, partial [Pyricularia pennisetigena]|uniref:hypothetical protein n=1 Tax=Pyricularia pennisetigena TaxID=1578925 RepID=UPI00114D7176
SQAPESRGQKRRREAQGASQPEADAPAPQKRRIAKESRSAGGNQATRTKAMASQRSSKRRRLDQNDTEAADNSGVHAGGDRTELQTKRRGRPPDSTAEVDAGPPVPTKNRRRPPRISSVTAAVQSPAMGGSQPKRKRGRPSLVRVAVDEAQNQQSRSDDSKPAKKRGRPSLSENHQVQPRPVSKLARRSAEAAKPSADLADTSIAEPRKSQPGPRGSSKPRPRNSTGGGRDEDPTTETDEDPDTRHKGPLFEGEYQYITERMVTVPRSKISSKWSPLDIKSVTAVHDILLNAQRPVLYHLRHGRRRQEHAASIMTAVANRVQRKLGRGFPFPPPTIGTNRTSTVTTGQASKSGHAEELDYERAVDAAQALEDQLNPTLHSVALLKAELKKQEKALEDDYKSLRTLESNARDEARSWKKSMRTTHILAPETISTLSNDGHDGKREGWKDLELVMPKRQDDNIYQVCLNLEDVELVKISQQIGSHMESIQGNLRQVGRILPAMETTKAALHEALLKHLDPTKCEEVLLG